MLISVYLYNVSIYIRSRLHQSNLIGYSEDRVSHAAQRRCLHFLRLQGHVPVGCRFSREIPPPFSRVHNSPTRIAILQVASRTQHSPIAQLSVPSSQLTPCRASQANASLHVRSVIQIHTQKECKSQVHRTRARGKGQICGLRTLSPSLSRLKFCLFTQLTHSTTVEGRLVIAVYYSLHCFTNPYLQCDSFCFIVCQ